MLKQIFTEEPSFTIYFDFVQSTSWRILGVVLW